MTNRIEELLALCAATDLRPDPVPNPDHLALSMRIAQRAVKWDNVKWIALDVDSEDRSLIDAIEEYEVRAHSETRDTSEAQTFCGETRRLPSLTGQVEPNPQQDIKVSIASESKTTNDNRRGHSLRGEETSHCPNRIGRFEIVKIVGRGAMGVVYLAYDPHLRRNVAVKVPYSHSSESNVDRVKAIAKVTHPNVCPIYDIGHFGDSAYIVMPILNGETLATIISRDAPLPATRAINILGNLASGLQALHTCDVVHRDLKPSNIMASENGAFVIVDFGLAFEVGKTAESGVSETVATAGTLNYLAPELISSKKVEEHHITAACDVYALGVIFFELLTGALPSNHQMDWTSLTRKTLGSFGDELQLSHNVERICRKMLARDPKHRFHDGGAVVEVLRSMRLMPQVDMWAPASAKMETSNSAINLFPDALATKGVAETQCEWPIESANRTRIVVRDRKHRAFIEELSTELLKGSRFIPLVGAGLSVDSAMPTVRDIHEYMMRCSAILNNSHVSQGVSDLLRCDSVIPSESTSIPWPSLHSVLGDRVRQLVDNGLEHSIRSPRSQLQSADQSTADWRSAVRDLCRLRKDVFEQLSASNGATACNENAVGQPPGSVKRHFGGASNAKYIDSFFQMLEREPMPGMAHRMLALLCDGFSVPLVLTTNFDTLIERAFSEVSESRKVFDVVDPASIPNATLLNKQRAVVKLHGGDFGLRYKLRNDSEVNETHRRWLVEVLENYRLTGVSDPALEDRGVVSGKRSSHLLMLGVTGSERRIESLLEAAVEFLNTSRDGTSKVFWICSSSAEFENAERQRSRLANDHRWARRFVVLDCRHAGVVLMETYQLAKMKQSAFKRSISRSCTQKSHVLPKSAVQPRIHYSLSENIGYRIDSCIEDPSNRQRMVVVSAERESFGLASVAATVFARQSDIGRQCIWIDLEETLSMDDVLVQLLHLIASRLSTERWMSVVMDDEYSSAADSALDRLVSCLMSESGKSLDWVVFLYAGNLGNDHWTHPDCGERQQPGELLRVMMELAGKRSSNVTVVLLCGNEWLLDRVQTDAVGIIPLHQIDCFVSSFEANATARRSLTWSHSDVKNYLERVRFLHAMCLADLSRSRPNSDV